MSNKIAKGRRTLKKAIEYYQNKGYSVEKLEVNKMTFIKNRIIPIRTDILASDLAVWNDREFILCQVRSNPTDISKARHKFEELKLPSCVKKVIILIENRKQPKIVEV